MRNTIKKILLFIIIGFSSVFLFGFTDPIPETFYQLTQLPETVGRFNVADESTVGNIAEATFTRNVETGNYDAEFLYKEHKWIVNDIVLKADTPLKNKFTGFYWTDKHPETDEVTRFIAYQTEGKVSRYEHLIENYKDKNIEPFMAWTLWNLNDGTTQTDMKMDVYSKVHLENGIYYVDTVLGVPNDDILTAVIEFDYRVLKKPPNFLGLGEEWYDWQTVEEYIVEKDKVVDVPFNFSIFRQTMGMSASWWGNFEAGFIVGVSFGGAYAIRAAMHDSNIPIIQKIQYNEAQKREYVDIYNERVDYMDKRGEDHELTKVTVNEVFTASNNVYRIYLDHLTSKEQSFQYKKFATLYLAYTYRGTIYSVATENIRSRMTSYYPQTPGEKGESFWDSIKQFFIDIANWFKKNKWWFIGIGVVIGVGFVAYLFGPAIREGSKSYVKKRKVKSKKSRKKPKRKGKR